jgi:hypothetical protein
MSNKALWDRVKVTDPKAVKPITGKQYSGNSPKPYWIIERLTDEFGPCGIGWGFTILNERIERFSDTDTLHIAVVRFWYMLDSKRGELEQIGQTKASYTTNAGKFMLDEDAPKKSVTDALIKCASYLGFAGDIFSGRWTIPSMWPKQTVNGASARKPPILLPMAWRQAFWLIGCAPLNKQRQMNWLRWSRMALQRLPRSKTATLMPASGPLARNAKPQPRKQHDKSLHNFQRVPSPACNARRP